MHKQGGTKRAEGEADWQKIKTTSTQASRPLLGLICHCLPNWVTGQEYQPCTAVCWLGKLLSFLGGVLVPVFLQTGARRNRYLRLLSGHVKQSKPCLQGLGGAPRAYYLVLTFLCLSQRDSHQQVFSPPLCLLYVHTDCTFSPTVSEFLLVLVLQICKLLCCNKQAMNHAICAQVHIKKEWKKSQMQSFT